MSWTLNTWNNNNLFKIILFQSFNYVYIGNIEWMKIFFTNQVSWNFVDASRGNLLFLIEDRNSSSPSCPKTRKNVSLRANGYEVRFIGDNLFLFFCQPRVWEEISFPLPHQTQAPWRLFHNIKQIRSFPYCYCPTRCKTTHLIMDGLSFFHARTT